MTAIVILYLFLVNDSNCYTILYLTLQMCGFRSKNGTINDKQT